MISEITNFVGGRYRAWRTSRSPHYSTRTPQELLDAAFHSAPWYFRWLPISLSASEIEAFIDRSSSSHDVAKAELKEGAKVWPFVVNENTLAMRKGYVLVRGGRPRAVVLTEIS